jgi:hypothetical protein
VPTAMTTVLGSLREMVKLRPELVKLPGFDVGRFDKLRDYALALGHTHGGYRAAQGPVDPIGKLSEEVSALRDLLHTDALALAKRGLLDEGRVGKLRSGVGHRNVAFDVVGLVQVLREKWGAVASKTAVTEQELEHAAEVAQQLVIAVGVKDQAAQGAPAATLLRQQAFTLFVNAYDDARRGVSFLRWHAGDLDTIAPSIWAGRRGRKVEEEEAEPALVPGATPATPSGAVLATAAAATAPAVAVGLPGTGPFTH